MSTVTGPNRSEMLRAERENFPTKNGLNGGKKRTLTLLQSRNRLFSALHKMKQGDFTMLNENLSGFFLIDPTLLEISLTSVLIQDNGGVTSSFPIQSTRLIK